MGALENLVGDMTLSELSSRTGRSVSEIVEYAVRSGQRTQRAGSKAVAGKRNGTASAESSGGEGSGPATGRSVDTRTSAGRERFDDTVLALVRRARRRIGAVEVRNEVGGTAQQVRTALHRLIERKAVVAEGQTRATMYRAT